MRYILAGFLLCASMALYAQEQRSLLWEISGNGLTKSSYLYGTMHVSKKIAFRLDDVFYEALIESEAIALESDPGTWLQNDLDQGTRGITGTYGFDTKGFYTYPFLLKSPGKQELATYLNFDDRFINNILYRTSEFSQNFEENTYLDMFIYQAGSKFNKPIIALEDLEESTALVGRASMNAMKRKPDEWLQKKMQGHDLMFLMQDAYRERNINLLDSIDKAMYTEYYRENMLYIRNENMAQRLEELMPHQKVFAGVGAAHLAGDKGVLSILRKKGYIVQPLTSETTEKGRKLKVQLEKAKRQTPLKRTGPEDSFFSMLLPNKLYPVSEQETTIYVAPDLANGSYVMINRVPTHKFLKPTGLYDITDIEALLFENIPGSILSKSLINKGGFQGLDIKNVLKNGDHQRYQIYLTPLEIIIFKMSGEGNFVLNHSPVIFDSLEFNSLLESSLTLSSSYKDFEILFPTLHRYTNQSRNGHRFIEGYKKITDTYYFLKKATLNDLNFIEADTFELKQIQKRFYQDLDLQGSYEPVVHNSLRSQVLFDSINRKQLYLKTVIKRGDYYLLGVLSKNKSEADTFFNSFKLKEATYPEPFRMVKDTALLFTTVSTLRPPKFVESSSSYHHQGQKPKSYSPYTKKTIYQNKNNEAITVELNKAHDYMSFSTIDSVWALRKNQYLRKDFKIIRESKNRASDGSYAYQFILADSTSSRGILVKNVVKGGLLYELKALVDTVDAPSRFISDFYAHFKPQDTLIGRDLIEDKTSDFFAALRANDSIILKGYRFPIYNESHIDSLKYYISQFNYRPEHKHIQSHLIQRFGNIDNELILRFLSYYYGSSYNNSAAQTKILQTIAKKGDEASAELILDLLEQDLPLVSNSMEIHKIFKPFKDSLQLARKLYPKILEYSAISEYKLPIISLLADLKKQNEIKGTHYKKYKSQLLNDARIQLKRYLGRQNGSLGSQRRGISLSRSDNSRLLKAYCILLYPFHKEKEMAQFYKHLKIVKDPEIQTTYLALMAESDQIIPKELIESLALDVNSRALLLHKLKKINKQHLFPSALIVPEALAETALFEDRRYLHEKDTVIYVGEAPISSEGEAYTGYYFKTKSSQNFNKNFKMHLVVLKPGKEPSTEYVYKNEGHHISDTESDAEAMDYVTEAFLLRHRKRAVVYRPNTLGVYGYLGF